MKYIKTYKLFETVHIDPYLKDKDIILDIRDILLELDDEGFDIDLNWTGAPYNRSITIMAIATPMIAKFNDLYNIILHVRSHLIDKGLEPSISISLGQYLKDRILFDKENTIESYKAMLDEVGNDVNIRYVAFHFDEPQGGL